MNNNFFNDGMSNNNIPNNNVPNNGMLNNMPNNNVTNNNMLNNMPNNNIPNNGMLNNMSNNNIPNNKKKNNIYIFIIIGVILLAIILLIIFLGKDKNSNENLKDNNQSENLEDNSPDTNTEDNSSDTNKEDNSSNTNSENVQDSSTPDNSIIEKGDVIKVRESNINLDLKYISYDREFNEKKVAIKMEITNNRERATMIGADIKIYDSDNVEFTACTPKDPSTGETSNYLEPNQTLIINFECYIPSTRDKTEISEARYVIDYLDENFKDGQKTYILSLD